MINRSSHFGAAKRFQFSGKHDAIDLRVASLLLLLRCLLEVGASLLLEALFQLPLKIELLYCSVGYRTCWRLRCSSYLF